MGKLQNVLKENALLKQEIEHLIKLVKENETKHKGIQLVEDAFLMSESLEELEQNALSYLEEIFDIDKAVLFIDRTYFSNIAECKERERLRFTSQKTLRYAYVEKRPYFGTYLQGLISDFHVMEDIGSYLIAPIIENGTIAASLNMYSKSPVKISSEAHADFIRELALRVGISLKKLHNTFTIRFQAEHDCLTGVFNKGMMNDVLKAYIDKYKHSGKNFSFMLCDIDNFKTFNSLHGHLAGDNVLTSIVDSIKKSVEGRGTVGRFGGDEFYILIESADEEVIREIFDGILADIDRLAGEYNIKEQVGLSGGYVRIPDDMNIEECDAIKIVRMADLGLYHSKSSGKRIVSTAVQFKSR